MTSNNWLMKIVQFICILAATLIAYWVVGCSGSKSTSPGNQSELTFQVTGNTNVQIWTLGELAVKVTAKSGEKPHLTGVEFPYNAAFTDSANGTGVIDFCPTNTQILRWYFKVKATTSTATDSTTIMITVVDQPELRKALIPLALNNRWIYQSVTSRAIFDTVLIKTQGSDGVRSTWNGQLYPILSGSAGALETLGDSVFSANGGLQYVIPEQLPATINVISQSQCYAYSLNRQITWQAAPVVVPAGTFRGYFEYTASLTTACSGQNNTTIVEDILVKPGVGIIKISLTSNSGCSGVCTSQWELWGWTVQ